MDIIQNYVSNNNTRLSARLSEVSDNRPIFLPNTTLLIGIVGGEPNWLHSALRPQIGLLCQTRVIMMMEKLVE
jgi:hypothetical protein